MKLARDLRVAACGERIYDRQAMQRIEADSESGKLDFLIKETLDEKEKGRLKEL